MPRPHNQATREKRKGKSRERPRHLPSPQIGAMSAGSLESPQFVGLGGATEEIGKWMPIEQLRERVYASKRMSDANKMDHWKTLAAEIGAEFKTAENAGEKAPDSPAPDASSAQSSHPRETKRKKSRETAAPPKPTNWGDVSRELGIEPVVAAEGSAASSANSRRPQAARWASTCRFLPWHYRVSRATSEVEVPVALRATAFAGNRRTARVLPPHAPGRSRSA